MSLGIGVIGAGIMGADHARTFATKVARAHVVAICDQDSDRAQTAAADIAGARAETDALAVIGADDVDAVLVASPDATHVDYTVAAIRAGKPVICEKPMGRTPDECQAVLEAERSGGKRLVQVGFMRRFDPAYVDFKDRMENGPLGPPLMLHCAHRNKTVPSFFKSLMSITNSAVHEFDIIRWLLGTEIAAIRVFKSRSTPASTMHDPLLVVVEMDDGLVVDIELFLNCQYGYDIKTEALCEHGTLEMLPDVRSAMLRAGEPTHAYAPDWRPRFAAAYTRQAQAWIDGIERGQQVGSSAWDGYVATAVAEAGCKALESGEMVKIDLPPRPAFYD